MPIELEEFAPGDPARVGGRLATIQELGLDPTTGAERAIVWTVARPAKANFYQIRVELKGPALDKLERSATAIVDSIVFSD